MKLFIYQNNCFFILRRRLFILSNGIFRRRWFILKAFFDYYQDEKLNNMKKLLDINPFENELLNYYSYSKPITREDAIEKKIGKEIKNIQNKYPNKKN